MLTCFVDALCVYEAHMNLACYRHSAFEQVIHLKYVTEFSIMTPCVLHRSTIQMKTFRQCTRIVYSTSKNQINNYKQTTKCTVCVNDDYATAIKLG